MVIFFLNKHTHVLSDTHTHTHLLIGCRSAALLLLLLFYWISLLLFFTIFVFCCCFFVFTFILFCAFFRKVNQKCFLIWSTETVSVWFEFDSVHSVLSAPNFLCGFRSGEFVLQIFFIGWIEGAYVLLGCAAHCCTAGIWRCIEYGHMYIYICA